MAVYNTELYLAEAVDSVLAQDQGIGRVQLILVDDGSSDGSPAICDDYAARFPENILVIHKENGGVSSARNAGLEAAAAPIVNFMDSDDKFAPNVVREVLDFIARDAEEQADVYSIPLYFFDGREGQHQLNRKFSGGSRIIDLKKEPEMIQLHSNSAFIRKSVLDEMNIRFDTRLKFAEDARLIQEILIRKMKLGVVASCRYLYRIRSAGPRSAIQTAYESKAWWRPHLEYFLTATAERCRELLGYIPAFIQYTICYDLQWRVKREEFNHQALSPEDIAVYKQELRQIMRCVDDEIIFAQRHIGPDRKYYMLKLKYGEPAAIGIDADSQEFTADFSREGPPVKLGPAETSVRRADIRDGSLILEGWVSGFGDDAKALRIIAESGEEVSSETVWLDPPRKVTGLDDFILYKQYYRVRIRPGSSVKDCRLRFSVLYPFGKIAVKKINYEEQSVIRDVPWNFYCGDGWMVRGNSEEIFLRKVSKPETFLNELRCQLTLCGADLPYARKAALSRALCQAAKIFKRGQVWLISDEKDRAGGNGEALFRYLSEKGGREIRAYFALRKNSPDFGRMRQFGKVLDPDSKSFKLIYMLADRIISSSADEFITNPFYRADPCYCDIHRNKSFVYLGSGVLTEDLSDRLGYIGKHFRGFVTGGIPEYESVLKNEGYHYTENEVWLTGMPRYDLLYRNSGRKITVIPERRDSLFAAVQDPESAPVLLPEFEESAFFLFYSGLLNNERLLGKAEELGYSLQVMTPPDMAEVMRAMRLSEKVRILPEETLYRDIFAESDLILTDHSPAAFDFAYLRQPVIYAPFDTEEFRRGRGLRKPGRFDPARDGFGETVYDAGAAAEVMIEAMENGCQAKPEYAERADRFFAFRDRKNCERVYNKIREMKCR